MLPKSHRLSAADLRHFAGRRLTTPTLHCVCSPSVLDHYRVAFIIPNRVYKKAHDRHRLKRILSHTIRPHLNTPPFYDVLFITQPQAAQVSETQILADLSIIISTIWPVPLNPKP